MIAALGKYTDLRLSQGWLPVSDGLHLINFSLNCPSVPSPAGLVALVLNVFDKRLRTVLLLRFAHNQTLAGIGDNYNLARERVRRMGVVALKRLIRYAPTFSVHLGNP